jgi:predicted protein tyrosine phosphatase
MREALIMNRRAAETIQLGDTPVVSITCPDSPQAQLKRTQGAPLLETKFFDYTEPGNIQEHEANRIFHFLERNKNADQVLIHCEAGLSRSAAVGLFCSERYGAKADLRGKFPNLELVRLLRKAAGAFDDDEGTIW